MTVALLVTLSLNHPEIRGPLFIPAILASAWYGGTGPALLAVGLSVLGINYLLVPPRFALRPVRLDDAVYLVVFSLSALLVAWLAATRRRTEEARRRAHDELSDRMQDLARANERLRAEIVERERAEAEVQKQASLLDLTHDSVFVRDVNDVITYWNRGAAERYGWSSEEAGCFAGQDVSFTAWLTNAVVGRRFYAISYSPLRTDPARVDAALATTRDLTEHLEASEALQEAQAELARITRVTMLGEITASLAHEVNQPLAAAVMNGNACRRWLAADPPNVDEARKAAQRIVSDGERAGQVIGRIRALVRRATPETSPLDVNGVIGESLGFTRGELERETVAIRAELRDDLPPVVGDRVQLQQVLMNLILNGVDAMAGITERPRVLTIRSRREDSHRVLVEVEDCGRGHGSGQLDRMFDAFFSTKPGGLGMGLSISRSIVEAHGGTIWATPNDGAGVTMRFTLPAGPGGA